MFLSRYIWALPNSIIGLLFWPSLLFTNGRARAVDGVLELHGPFIAWVLRHLVPLPGGAAAITLGHVVLGRDADALSATRVHERVHVRQYERWGPLFIPAYLIAAMWAALAGTGAYQGNYFERAAVHGERAVRPVRS
jgi:hypothetical protein